MTIPKIRHVLIEKYNTEIGLKARFLDFISCGLIVKIDENKYPNSIFLFDGCNYIFEYNRKTNIFWCSYDNFWSIFQAKYSLNNQKIIDLVNCLVEKHFKIKEVTPKFLIPFGTFGVEKHFKIKGVTPLQVIVNTADIVEKHFKIKDIT